MLWRIVGSGDEGRWSAIRIVGRLQGAVPTPVLRIVCDGQDRGYEKDGDNSEGYRNASELAAPVTAAAPTKHNGDRAEDHSRNNQPVGPDGGEHPQHPTREGDRRFPGTDLIIDNTVS